MGGTNAETLQRGGLMGFLECANAWREGHVAVINLLAPVYFALFVGMRVYLETAVFAPTPFFSYYTACHHMLWFAGTFLSIILVLHAVLRIPLRDMAVLTYGVTLTGLPLLYAVIMGQDLKLTYLRGSAGEIFTHILSFVWTYEADRALTGELVLIFLGVLGLGLLTTRSLKRALLGAVFSYAAIMAWAVHWVGRNPHRYAVFSVNTWMASNCLLSVLFLHIVTLLAFVGAWRAGLLSEGRKAWKRAALAGAAAWAGYVLFAWSSGWFLLPFDILTSGLPFFMNFFVLAALVQRKRFSLPGIALGLFTGLLAVHLLVMGPLLLRSEESLITPGERWHKAKRLEAAPGLDASGGWFALPGK